VSLTHIPLAIGETASILCLVGQIAWIVLAALVGRFLLRSRPAIHALSIVGGVGAMVSHMMFDGQGACLLVPLGWFVAYAVAAVGREDLRP
jgi:hypothetical protein